METGKHKLILVSTGQFQKKGGGKEMALEVTTTLVEENKQVISLKQRTILEVCEAVILAMADGLPDEAHTIEVFEYILKQTEELLHNKPLKLK